MDSTVKGHTKDDNYNNNYEDLIIINSIRLGKSTTQL